MPVTSVGARFHASCVGGCDRPLNWTVDTQKHAENVLAKHAREYHPGEAEAADPDPSSLLPDTVPPADHLDLTSAAQSVVATLDATAAGDLGNSHATVATILWHRLVGGTEEEAVAYARALAADPDTRVHAHTAPF